MSARPLQSRAVTEVRQVRHVAGAEQQIAMLPRELSTPLRVQLESFHGQDVQEGTHVELLLVDGHAVRMNFFVDVDGTLWIEHLSVAERF